MSSNLPGPTTSSDQLRDEPAGRLLISKAGRGGRRPGAGRKPKLVLGQRRGSFVYVVHETGDAGVCKIGIACDPYRRLATLQIGTWRRLSLAATFWFQSEDVAGLIEGAVHSALSGVHEVGEWFRVDAARAADEIVGAAQRLGVSVRILSADDLVRE